MTNNVEGQMTLQDVGISFGKMCQEHSQATVVRTSGASSKKSPKLSKKMPIYLDLRRGGGHTQDASWEMGGPLLGEYTMLSFGEFPKEENASLLSQILEEQAHPKYSLSAKACLGILRRAENRGKKLPDILREALENQVKADG